jgi:hypothetical protein
LPREPGTKNIRRVNMAKGKTNVLSMIGFWAFIIGLIVAVVAGILMPQNQIIIIVLIILGLIIGFLNITAKEMLLFLVATIALIVVGNVFAPLKTLMIGAILGSMLSYVATLMAPAAIVAAIKALWAVGKPGD